MSFPDFTMLQPGDQFTNRTSAQGPVFLPGQVGVMPNGDRFRYTQMGASVAGVVGKFYQGPPPVTNHVLQTAAAAAVGASTVALTLGNTAAAANDYINGTLVIDLASNTGFGYTYHIGAHGAVAASGVFTVPFAGSPSQSPQSDGLILPGNETVQVAIATTANSVSIYPNPFKKIVITVHTGNGGATAVPVGVLPRAMGTSSWGWIQTTGVCMCLTNGTVIIGSSVVLSVTTDGAVEAHVAGAAETDDIVGTVVRVATSTNYSTVNLTGVGFI